MLAEVNMNIRSRRIEIWNILLHCINFIVVFTRMVTSLSCITGCPSQHFAAKVSTHLNLPVICWKTEEQSRY
jgi:hypothetical protein